MSEGLDESALDLSELADLVAKHGNATCTAWLETDRYHTWQPSKAIPESSFTPVQGYLHSGVWVFAWGNPIVSDPKAFKPTLQAFISAVESKGMRCVYCCVDSNIEEVLAGMNWSTVSCINEDIVDPENVVELTSEDSEGHGSMVKDLKKNLRRAERAQIDVTEIQRNDWSETVRKEIEDGVDAWKKSRSGLQLAATSFDPFLDFEHRRYWVARSEGKAVGVLILSPVRDAFVIKNAVSFPKAPKGTSEYLITSALKDLRNERQSETGSVSRGDISVTFNISAASDLKPTKNVSGWKFTWLNKTYSNVSQGAGLLNRGDFRSKFDSSREPMFVCYPSEDGFGLDGIEMLIKLLRR
ncbi:hypothetical protein K503DRAFT_791499 [Rhizopogon vinicolor AM-OR11-026]|uniref:Phosphatidylglycerol lysyltransferase C-terminal domain-containing protein n=1 Tax=Rhizopogon vinicolor AM-OR11-026 TaxID=1314800 RepID=A0A1B7N5S4_9AGAM|nr:hypothetical protein K503DRAFT_791499 [Rhizopogon vinicolor AM-OR11-026]